MGTEEQKRTIQMTQKHDTLTSIIYQVLATQGLKPERNIVYDVGEMDVLCQGIYYEVKCNITDKQTAKAIDQIDRAIRNRKAEYGYMVTYQGLYDVLKHEMS